MNSIATPSSLLTARPERDSWWRTIERLRLQRLCCFDFLNEPVEYSAELFHSTLVVQKGI